ncbi:hypothetical protein CSIV_01570 [Microbacterium sp. CSI-V]|uniref:amidohydrolase family protein n=1 Tax=unclassified Microbacterium TaxID=2609290 RepID=UPI00097BFF7E|nr:MULTISPECIES: amidohydrolase family protein [unclassified Microbacterium]MXS75319.1 amidohydrolase [Microbacterium sp. TL13]ONI66337.1 hypothetical protein CSIV_01570 [Microbacterium sp. CSI-V]
MTIDAHVHLWDRTRNPQPWIEPETMGAIDRDFDADDLERALGTEVTGAVVVQARNTLTETRDLLAAAASSEIVRGVVGWVDLAGDVAEQVAGLRACAGGDRLVGIRHLVHRDPDPLWLARADVHEGLRQLAHAGLPFDLVIRHHQAALAVETVAAHPDLTFVLDHLGMPPLVEGDLDAWADDLERLAAHPHVRAKLSGLPMESDWATWTPETLRPVVEHALGCFGEGRLLFGSDWPLVLLPGGLQRWRDAARTLVPPERHADVFTTAAATTYRLELPRA